MDIWSQEKRSAVMARIRGKDTKPELIVRSLLHRAGLRFSLRRKDLPGKPDVVLAMESGKTLKTEMQRGAEDAKGGVEE